MELENAKGGEFGCIGKWAILSSGKRTMAVPGQPAWLFLVALPIMAAGERYLRPVCFAFPSQPIVSRLAVNVSAYLQVAQPPINGWHFEQLTRISGRVVQDGMVKLRVRWCATLTTSKASPQSHARVSGAVFSARFWLPHQI
jgi:hypothetical protein